jgi:hypothetical protein
MGEKQDEGVIWNCRSCRTMPQTVEPLMASVVALSANVESLTKLVSSLQQDNQAMRAMLQTCGHPTSVGVSGAAHAQLANDSKTQNYADVVRNSVREVLQEQSCKNDDMIARAEENGQDKQMVNNLCDKLDLNEKPVAVQRVGRPKTAEPPTNRLLNATFANRFDARIFLSKADELKNDEDDSIKRIRCRPCRSTEEQPQ